MSYLPVSNACYKLGQKLLVYDGTICSADGEKASTVSGPQLALEVNQVKMYLSSFYFFVYCSVLYFPFIDIKGYRISCFGHLAI